MKLELSDMHLITESELGYLQNCYIIWHKKSVEIEYIFFSHLKEKIEGEKNKSCMDLQYSQKDDIYI